MPLQTADRAGLACRTSAPGCPPLLFDLLGQQTVVFETLSRALDAPASRLTYGEQHVGRPLLTPDEVRNLPQQTELLFLAGKRPVIAQKLRYYDEREFAGRFDAAAA